MNDHRELRRAFLSALVLGLKVVWPILSGSIVVIVVLGIIVGSLEGWALNESIYFSFITGLTIGFGDFVPKSLLTRILTVLIGACGILLTALIAAVAVKALTTTLDHDKK